MKEYALWALPKGETDRLHEQVLTSTTSSARVEQVKELAGRDGWHGFRVQVLDGTVPDFAGTLASKPRK